MIDKLCPTFMYRYNFFNWIKKLWKLSRLFNKQPNNYRYACIIKEGGAFRLKAGSDGDIRKFIPIDLKKEGIPQSTIDMIGNSLETKGIHRGRSICVFDFDGIREDEIRDVIREVVRVPSLEEMRLMNGSRMIFVYTDTSRENPELDTFCANEAQSLLNPEGTQKADLELQERQKALLDNMTTLVQLSKIIYKEYRSYPRMMMDIVDAIKHRNKTGLIDNIRGLYEDLTSEFSGYLDNSIEKKCLRAAASVLSKLRAAQDEEIPWDGLTQVFRSHKS